VKQYISHFSIDRQGKVTPDAAFDDSQFEVQFDENEQPALTSEITNVIDDVVSSHVNNKLEFIGQNIHNIFDDRFSRIESYLGMKPIGSDNNASTSNTDKAMNDSANCKSSTNNALVINSATSVTKLIIIQHLMQMCQIGQQVRCSILRRRTLLNIMVHLM